MFIRCYGFLCIATTKKIEDGRNLKKIILAHVVANVSVFAATPIR